MKYFEKVLPIQQGESPMSTRLTTLRAVAALGAILAPTAAFAHAGHDSAVGFVQGFVHPVSGLDHVLAMIAVGLFAANLGGRALWAVPLSFVAVMALGGALGVAGIAVPFVEAGIAVSVFVLGLAVALRWRWSVTGAMALVGGFAVFHGHAHGAEMPVDAAGLAYGIGFVLATAILHAMGLGLGLGTARFGSKHAPRAIRFGGAAMAVAGLGILTGVV
jgi:urease accessory protein